jgi:hypothetical protein
MATGVGGIQHHQLPFLRAEKATLPVRGGDKNFSDTAKIVMVCAGLFFASIFFGIKPLIVVGILSAGIYGLYQLFKHADFKSFGSGGMHSWSTTYYPYFIGSSYSSSSTSTSYSTGSPSNSTTSSGGTSTQSGFTPDGSKMVGSKKF